MATDYTALGDIQLAPTGRTLVDPSLFHGRVRVAFCHFETTALAAGSTIYLAKLPKGARLQPLSLLILEAGQDAGLTLTCGDDDVLGEGLAVDADRYLLAQTPGANDDVILFAIDGNVDAPAWEGGPVDANSGKTCYKLGSESWITLTTGAKTVVADKFLIAWLYYVVD